MKNIQEKLLKSQSQSFISGSCIRIVVVPPATAASVPDWKSSTVVVFMNSNWRCVCGSTPPGSTSFPRASTTVAPGGACRPRPTALNICRRNSNVRILYEYMPTVNFGRTMKRIIEDQLVLLYCYKLEFSTGFA